MKVTLLILFIIYSNTIFTQSIKKTIEILEKKSFLSFKHFITKVKPSEHCSSPEETTNREILTNYREVVADLLLFTPTPKGEHVGQCNYYQINLIAKNNEIIRYDLYSKRFGDTRPETYKLLKNYSNEEEIEIFQDLFEKKFYRKLNLNELFDNSITYGQHCGIVGVNPKERDLLEIYIDSKDREGLFYWLTSPSFEKKLYGYEGYKVLMDKGYRINEKEKIIIEGLRIFRGSVRTCSGCFFMHEGFGGIINQINQRKIDTAVLKPQDLSGIMNQANEKKIDTSDSKNNSLKLILFSLGILLTIGLFYKMSKR